VLDLMGKDESTLARDKQRKEEKLQDEIYNRHLQEKRAVEDG
jgi:hypothetical protein